MASTTTGEMFTQEEVDAMTTARRQELDLVRLEPDESVRLAPMSNEERKQYLRTRKSKVRRSANKRQRQNRKVARNAAR